MCPVLLMCCCWCLQENPLECEDKSSSSPVITSSRSTFGRSNSYMQEDSTVQVRPDAAAAAARQQLTLQFESGGSSCGISHPFGRARRERAAALQHVVHRLLGSRQS
jgi:hypothetical protein